MIQQDLFPVEPAVRLTLLAIVLGLMVLEYLIGRLVRHHTHDLAESAASFGVAIGRNLIKTAEAGLLAMPFLLAYDNRLFDIPISSPLIVIALFLAVEFSYYWQHRAAHRVRWLWATHVVHHTPAHYNFTAAIRLGWTGMLSGNFVFFLPLAWIGFHPLAVIGMLAVTLLYQFLLHSELWPRLGPLERVLNTPAHHRVHHASNDACLDRNYGGVLIIFDRLFGTFAEAPRDEQLRYGVVGAVTTYNPVRIALGEWVALVRDTCRTPGLIAKIKVAFGAPRVAVPVAKTSTPVLPAHTIPKGDKA